MSLPQFEFAEPKTLRRACQLLEDDRAMAIAGGTDLLQSLKNRLKSPRVLVDLRNIPRLNQISFSNKTGLMIGALVSLRQLANSTVVQEKYPMLAKAASQVGSPQLQAMGTVGGNLCQDTMCLFYNRPPMTRQMLEPCLKLGGRVCHPVPGSNKCWAVYSGDLAPVLIALGAKVVIANAQGTKTIPLRKFFSDDGLKPNVLKRGQILTEIHLSPPAPRSGGVYLKLRVRQTIDYPLLGVAVSVRMDDRQICTDATLALTGVDMAPLVIPEAEQLKGKKIDDDAIAQLAQAAYKRAHPLNNVSELPPAYRKEMVKVYVRQAVREAVEKI